MLTLSITPMGFPIVGLCWVGNESSYLSFTVLEPWRLFRDIDLPCDESTKSMALSPGFEISRCRIF